MADIANKYLNLDLNGLFLEQNHYNLTTRKLNDKKQLCEFLQWGRRNPSRFCEEIFNVQFLDYQRYCFDMSWNRPFVVWAESRSAGKALSLDTPILRPDGTYSTIEDIQVGDKVVGDHGKPVKVIAVSPIFYNHDCYKITFSDGEEIVADGDHLWSVYVKRDHHKDKDTLYDMTTREMAQKYTYEKPSGVRKEYLYSVPLCQPVQHAASELSVDPYILGLWLGDGSKSAGFITSGGKDYKEMIRIIEDTGYKIYSVTRDHGDNKRLTIHMPNDKPLISTLSRIKLKCNKHIPDKYKYGSVNQRIALIQGLMDTDGTCKENGTCEFYQTDYKLMCDFSEILTSLGIKNKVAPKYIKVSKNSNEFLKSYRCSFIVDKEHSCFRLPRKHNRLKDHLRRSVTRKAIIKIEQVPSVPTKCLFVNNRSHRFLCGKKNTVTHNSILASLFIMTKMILIPNFTCYILAGVGAQSIELFTKMEQFAKKQIQSFPNLNDIFQNNVIKSQANSDGWTHSPSSYSVRTYGGARCFTLNGNQENNRGKRSNLNVYD